jgi:hypothetical protein
LALKHLVGHRGSVAIAAGEGLRMHQRFSPLNAAAVDGIHQARHKRALLLDALRLHRSRLAVDL